MLRSFWISTWMFFISITRTPDVIWSWPSSKGQRSKLNSSETLLLRTSTWCMQLLTSYHIPKAAWPWASLKVQKGHTTVRFTLDQEFDVENIPRGLQQNTCNLWRVIVFTMYCWMLADQAVTTPLQPKGAEW